MAEIRDNLTNSETWIRGLYMLLFFIVYGAAEFVLTLVVIFQFGSKLITGHANSRLLDFGGSLSTFIYEILLFLTFRTEEKPFPFRPWPASGTPVRTTEAPTPAAGAQARAPAPPAEQRTTPIPPPDFEQTDRI